MTSKKNPSARIADRPRPPVLKPEPAIKPVPATETEEVSWDEAIDEYEKSRQPEAPAVSEAKKPKLDPAEIAATILLERAVLRLPVLAEELRRHGTVSVLTVPDEAWTEPAYAAWKSSVSGKEWTVNAHYNSRLDRQPLETVALLREDEPDKFRRKQDDATFAEASWRTLCIVGISPVDGWLPVDLVAAADFRVILPKLDAATACELARRLTDSEPTLEITDAEVEGAGPRTLRLARRPDQTADQYLRKVLEIVAASATPPSSAKEKVPTSIEPRDCMTLDRMAGMDEAVGWGKALAADLSAFKAGIRSWAEVDRGLLLSGQPGCGKTVFASALARTCGVPLITGSYSTWLGTGSSHQGTLLKAMRETFAAARAAAPCILFLDEIDSFPNRGELTHSHKNWDIQVVNSLLAEIDGTEARPGVVVVGACNNPHLLDPALVRSGRLDRHIRISMPVPAALATIMREHLGDDLTGANLDGAALLAVGSSGADVERMVRGARRRARAAARPMKLTDLLAEIAGSDERTADDMKRAAVHEAGHAVIWLELGVPVMGITIRTASGDAATSRGTGLGVFPTDRHLRDETVCLLAGRAAETVILGEPCCGSGGGSDSDLARATMLAARAVSEFGFDERAGLVWRPVPEHASHWPSLDPMVTAAVRTRLADAFSNACAIIVRRRSAVEELASVLLDRVAMDGQEINRIVEAIGRGDPP